MTKVFNSACTKRAGVIDFERNDNQPKINVLTGTIMNKASSESGK
jgi:hypothetical protein